MTDFDEENVTIREYGLKEEIKTRQDFEKHWKGKAIRIRRLSYSPSEPEDVLRHRAAFVIHFLQA